MEITTLTLEAEPTIFAFQRFQSTISTKMVIRTTEVSSMALSMKCRLRKISMTTMHLVPSAMSNHVVQCWWCPLGTTVHLDGARSIMGIWWLNIIPTKAKKTSSVSTETLSLFPAAARARMEHCCTLWKESVANYHVVRMLQVESWLALCVLSDRRERPFYRGFLTGDESVIFKNELYWF